MSCSEVDHHYFTERKLSTTDNANDYRGEKETSWRSEETTASSSTTTFWCHEDLSSSSGKVLLEGHVPGCKSYCRLQWIILCLPIIIVKCDSAGDTVSSVSADEQEARYCSSRALSSTSEVTLVSCRHGFCWANQSSFEEWK